MMAAMRPDSGRLLLATLLPLVLAIACSLPGGRQPGPTATATPSLTLTPSPTATATASPRPEQRLASAEDALWIGDWEAALASYQVALQSAQDVDQAGAAQLGIGTTYLRAGEPQQAEQALTQFLSDYPGHGEAPAAYFLRGVARVELGQSDAAVQDFLAYLEAGSVDIQSTVYELIGDQYARAGEWRLALQHYQTALDSPRLASPLPVQVKIANMYASAGDYQSAIDRYDLVFEAAGDASTKATMNLLAGQALENLGDIEAAQERYLQSVHEFPEAYSSYEGLVRLVDAGVEVDDFQRGLVDYFADAHQPALLALNRAIATSPTAAAYYYRGLTLRELGDPSSATGDFAYLIAAYPESQLIDQAWLEKAFTERAYLNNYQASVATYLAFADSRPESPPAAEALFAAGRTAELNGDLEWAAEIWTRLANDYPARLGHQGAFEAGIVYYRLELYQLALQSFQTALGIAPDQARTAAAQLWIGKTQQVLGEDPLADQAWQQAVLADPTGYYSERARDLLNGREPFDPIGVADFNVDMEAERMEAEQWLRETFGVDGPEPLTEPDEALLADPRLLRGREYHELGMFMEAKAEFDALREALANDAEASYRLLHELLELRHYATAIFTARQILDLAGMDDAGTMNAPTYFNRIRFGPYFGELILPAAQENGLDSLLALSVTRQESLFEGFVTSFAQARGLMQVIPSTGQEIANRLGWPPDYTADDLYRPMVSIRFGTFYLGQQRDLFEGRIYPALAAYNGGPANALAWHRLAPDDPDLFLEVIRIPETHLYLQRIYEIHSIYEDLYVPR